MPDSIAKGRTQAKPGASLRALRKQRGWTLAEVSERTGLPIPTLSRVENDKMALSFDKLVRISEGLQIDIAELIESSGKATVAEGGSRRVVTRAGEGKAIETQRGNYLYVASELRNKKIVPIIGEVLAKDVAAYGEFMQHPGEEYLYVLEGTLELHTEVYTPVRLEKGDSVYFDSGMPHAYIAVGDKPCRVLSICATPEAHLIGSLERLAEVKTASSASTRKKRRVRKG
jgi:transcriptional regulator with XRE-family HTH domain